MAKTNYYQLLEILPYGHEADDMNTINAAIARWEQKERIRSTDDEDRETLQHLKDDITACMSDTRRRKAEARECRERAISITRFLHDITTITEGAKCPRCHKTNAPGDERCSCGFDLVASRHFDYYVDKAKNALGYKNITEAEQLIIAARDADPARKKELAGPEHQLEQIRYEYDGYVKQISELLAEGFYRQADQLIEKLRTEVPAFDFETQHQTIRREIRRASDTLAAAAGRSGTEMANACYDVLQTIKDYGPAKDILATLQPQAPNGLRGSAEHAGNNMVYRLSWQGTAEKGVSYTVIRKEGGEPAGPSDGKPVAENIGVCETSDPDFASGTLFYYAVFARRFDGRYSKPCIVKAIDFTSPTYDIRPGNGKCGFVWNTPTGAQGIRIQRRKENGAWEEVARYAHPPFEDIGLVNGCRYEYKLNCDYKNGRSEPKHFTVVPAPLPDMLESVTAEIRDAMATIRWKPAGSNNNAVKIKRIENEGLNMQLSLPLAVKTGDIPSLLGGGNIVAEGQSKDGIIEFPITDFGVYHYAALSESGSNSIICGRIRIVNVEDIGIDEQRTSFRHGELQIYLNRIPDGISRLHYEIRQDSKLKKRDKNDFTVPDYRFEGRITVRGLDPGDYSVRVYGSYIKEKLQIKTEGKTFKISINS
ncbi:MAG: hypothetical protein IK083_06200 [Abditibacteriota bacterium]|nr:hypothetical protein [Abditibacteriota bacterium]